MAVVNTKSATITGLDASPPTQINSHKHAGFVLQSYASAEVVAADDDTSVYRMVRIPSNARIISLGILNDAITDGTDYDLGVYDTQGSNAGAVVDANLFASVISMVTGRSLPLNAKYEAGVNLADGDQRLWEILGLSEDPLKFYDISYTANTVGSVAGTLALECQWAQ